MRFPPTADLAGTTLRRGVVPALLLLAACGGSSEADVADRATDGPDASDVTGVETGSAPNPPIGSTWQLQLQGDLDISFDVDVYDVDLFDTPVETIDRLHEDGRTVICYFSAGSWEEWRDDADVFDAEAIGNPLVDWEGERWFDIRSDSVRNGHLPRLDLAVEKRCDGVDPDNVTGFDTDSGFDLTADDQLDFNRFLSREARARGLLVGLKNDLVQIPELVDDFDFAINEQCHEFDECDAMQPFLDAGKPVFNVEYLDGDPAGFDDEVARVCASSESLGIATLVLPLALDGDFRVSCAPVDQ